MTKSPTRKARRSIVKKVRFSADEWAATSAHLGDADFSKTVRAHFLERRISPHQAKVAEAELALAAQLARYGNLLNQIARRANQGARGDEILVELIKLERLVKGEAP